MSDVIRAGSTTAVSEPGWTGSGFSDPTADAFWRELSESLRAVARAELAAGNAVSQVLRNDDRGIVLLEFVTGPLTAVGGPEFILHTSHEYGNYCYDGTRCTLEDRASGSFLAFSDPEWRDEE